MINDLKAFGEKCCYFYPLPFAKAGDIKTHSSVRLSVRHKNFNLAHIFWSINDRALTFCMHDPYDEPFHLAPCHDLDLDLDLLQGQSCCRAGDHNSPNLLVGSILTSSFWHDLAFYIGLSHFHLFSFKYFNGAKFLIYINLCTFHVKKNSARLQWYSCARYKTPGPLVNL